jgi:hypothetical protein
LNAGRSQQNRLLESSRDEKGNDDRRSKIGGAPVRYIQMVTSFTEGRFVGLAEIFAMLDKFLRQHSIDTAGKLPYAALCHQKNPP